MAGAFEDDADLFHAGGKPISPQICKSDTEQYYELKLRNQTQTFFNFSSSTTSAQKGFKSELQVVMDLRNVLSKHYPRHECVIIRGYKHLREGQADHIGEIDLLILSRTHGIFLFEVKEYQREDQYKLGRENIPVCPRGAVLEAWKQINEKTKQITTALLSDYTGFGNEYLTAKQAIATMCDRMKTRAVSVHTTVAYPFVDERCKIPHCKWCPNPTEQIGHQHRFIIRPVEENLLIYFEDQLSGRHRLEGTDDELHHLYMFTLRRFLLLEVIWHFYLPIRRNNRKTIAEDAKQMENRAGIVVSRTSLEVTERKTSILQTPAQIQLMASFGRLYVTGPAGSGKTVLLMIKVEKIMREMLHQEGFKDCVTNIESGDETEIIRKPLLVVCYTAGAANWIRAVLNAKFETYKNEIRRTDRHSSFTWFATVTTYRQFLLDQLFAGDNKLARETKRGPKGFDDNNFDKMVRSIIAVRRCVVNRGQTMCGKTYFHNIMLDECQDFYGDWQALFNDFWIESNNSVVNNSFWSFFDNDQNIMDEKPATVVPQDCQLVTLTELFRYTINIHGFISGLLMKKTTCAANVAEVTHFVRGGKVVINPAVPEIPEQFSEADKCLTDDGLKVATNIIHVVVEKLITTHTSPDDIVVLMRNANCVNQLIEKLRELNAERYVKSTDYCYGGVTGKVRLASVVGFRSLDAKLVVWYHPSIDQQCAGYSDDWPNFAYSAASRAISQLQIITTQSMRDKFVAGTAAGFVSNRQDFESSLD